MQQRPPESVGKSHQLVRTDAALRMLDIAEPVKQ